MRAAATLALFATAVFVSVGCTSNAPFQSISSVKVRNIGPKGLTEKKFEDEKAKWVTDCLYQTVEITEEETERELLQTTYLIEINDAFGDRSFELYTRQNLKGNKGKYYLNTCIHDIVKGG